MTTQRELIIRHCKEMLASYYELCNTIRGDMACGILAFGERLIHEYALIVKVDVKGFIEFTKVQSRATVLAEVQTQINRLQGRILESAPTMHNSTSLMGNIETEANAKALWGAKGFYESILRILQMQVEWDVPATEYMMYTPEHNEAVATMVRECIARLSEEELEGWPEEELEREMNELLKTGMARLKEQGMEAVYDTAVREVIMMEVRKWTPLKTFSI